MTTPWIDRARLLAAPLLFWLWSTACAVVGRDEIHLAPLYSDLSVAGGDRGAEALGGLALARFDGRDGRLSYWALRPVASWRREGEQRSDALILPPLGARFEREGETVTQFLPIWRYAHQHPASGGTSWQFMSLPGIYLSKNAKGQRNSAWFLFYGDVEKFLGFDRAQWVLFPLFARLERGGRTDWNGLFPIFQWSTGEGGRSWRVWPLYGHLDWKGRYRRRFLLWPLFIWQVDGLDRAPGHERTTVGFWPFLSGTRRHRARGFTFLWPFFGVATDAETGFWAWDGPWPLVTFQGGDEERAVRRRIWPFYSWYEGDGLQSEWILWPFYNHRRENYAEFSREAVMLASGIVDSVPGVPEGRQSSWRKLWPLVRWSKDEANETETLAWPALNPLPRLDLLDEHYTWLWELYSARRSFDRVRVRSWLGLYREESDRLEERRSIAGLWARRDYRSANGPVREVSFLFGLLRGRRVGEGSYELLAPRFPGPGWPLERSEP